MSLTPTRSCGRCNMCCKLPEIPEFEKPYDTWCHHCDPGRGCKAYAERPQRCRDFLCFWLQVDTLPDELRPDRCGVVLVPQAHPVHGRLLIAMVAPGQIGRVTKPRVAELLRAVQSDGFKVFVTDRKLTKQVLSDGTLVPAAPVI